MLTTAISNMEAAYTDAAGRVNPDESNRGAGDISGTTFVPGLYKWSSSVAINGDGVTLLGGPTSIFIFQIAGDLKQAANTQIFLTGGAQAKNVIWQVCTPPSV